MSIGQDHNVQTKISFSEDGIIKSVNINPNSVNLSNGEELLWSYNITQGFIRKKAVVMLGISNYRIMRVDLINNTVIGYILLQDLDDVIVMNTSRASDSIGYSMYAGSGGRFMSIAGKRFSSGTSKTVGDIVFIVNGKKITWYGLPDPTGLKNFVKSLMKTMYHTRELQKAKILETTETADTFIGLLNECEDYGVGDQSKIEFIKKKLENTKLQTLEQLKNTFSEELAYFDTISPIYREILRNLEQLYENYVKEINKIKVEKYKLDESDCKFEVEKTGKDNYYFSVKNSSDNLSVLKQVIEETKPVSKKIQKSILELLEGELKKRENSKDPIKQKDSKKDPLSVLKMRLAKGEISKEEYEDLKKLIEEE